MSVELARLRHIVAVATNKSFTKAADELNITQPALSRSIAAFEARHGFRLFDRSRTGVVATALGRTIIAEAASVLRAAQGLELNLNLYARGDAGQLAVGLGPLLASVVLPGLGAELLRSRPELQFRAAIGMPERLVDDLLADRLEMVFANSWGLTNTEELEIRPLGELPLSFVVRADHPLAGRGIIEADDLARFPLASATELIAAGLVGKGASFVCDNYHILRDLVLASDAVWLSSPALVAKDEHAERFGFVRVRGFGRSTSAIAMIARKGRTLSPAANAVAGKVSQLLSAE
jgi:DNA-binding transcriptional LysR family regulator